MRTGEPLRRGVLWTWMAVSGFVAIEPSPFEVMFPVALLAFADGGMLFDRALAPLVATLIVWSSSGFLTLIPWVQEQESVSFILITLYICLATILFAAIVARDALTRNVINRAMSEKHVQELVWEIETDAWAFTHQGFGFNIREEFVDGQHRAEAIARTGVSIPVLITFNLRIGFAAPIDTGLRVRQPKDVLPISSRIQAICNALIDLERPNHGRSSPSQVAEVLERYRPGIEWANQVFPYERGITAPLIAAHVFAHPVAPRAITSFAEQFVARTGSSSDEPAVVLRRYLDRPTRNQEGRALAFAALRCLEAHCKGQTIGRLVVNDSGFVYFTDRRAKKGL